MTPSEFLALLRNELFDAVTPYLWSDDDLYLYITEAQREFAINTKCIPDSNNYLGITYTADNPWIDLDKEIIEVRRAVTSDNVVLKIESLEEFSNSFYRDDYGWRKKAEWESDTGNPQYLLLDMEELEGRLYPIPTDDGEVDLYVWREPFNAITSNSTSFEIPEKYIYRLIYKVKALAYSKQDYETYNAAKVAENIMLWNEALSDAQSNIKKRTRKPRTVAYGGY